MNLSRRAFVRDGTMVMGTAPFLPIGIDAATLTVGKSGKEPVLRVGLVTDLHYADKAPAGTRHYREAIPKFEECIDRFNGENLDLAIELGDFIDAAEEVEVELGYLDAIEKVFAEFRGDRHYVLGNHCVWTLTKEQFRDHSGARATYYSFDKNGVHFVVLDACYRADGVSYENKNYEWTDTEIPLEEREWLREDLSRTDLPTLVFTHQRIDVANHYGVKSGEEVRDILRESGMVRAVFQGHNHLNEHREIEGIHYVTLAAAIEGAGEERNAYSVLEVYGDRLEVKGFRDQADWTL